MTDGLLAVCIRDPRNQLVAAECENLTGSRPVTHGIARCQTLDYIRHAAYIRHGVRILACGETLDRLIENLRLTSFAGDDFRIEFLRLSKQATVDHWEAILAVADAMPYYPNLDEPRHRFLLAAHECGFWFGEILTSSDHTYRQHETRPYSTSSALPSQLARALINLVTPSAQTILDPCCGTGSILLEACALGATAFGVDWNPRMVIMSRRNLEHFGYAADVEYTDAREWSRPADAVVTDLPYGNKLEMSEVIIRGILDRAAALTPVVVCVAGCDISNWFHRAGYHDIEVFRVPKYTGFMRYVHRARSDLISS